MTDDDTSPEAPEESPWFDERYDVAAHGAQTIHDVTVAAGIPTRDGVTWKAVTVATIGTDETGQTIAYLQYLQDISWRVSERTVLQHCLQMIRSRIHG